MKLVPTDHTTSTRTETELAAQLYGSHAKYTKLAQRRDPGALRLRNALQARAERREAVAAKRIAEQAYGALLLLEDFHHDQFTIEQLNALAKLRIGLLEWQDENLLARIEIYEDLTDKTDRASETEAALYRAELACQLHCMKVLLGLAQPEEAPPSSGLPPWM